MAGTTGAPKMTDDELDQWLGETGYTIPDIQRPGPAQREFIDFLNTDPDERDIPRPDPTREAPPPRVPPPGPPKDAPPPPARGGWSLPGVGDLLGGVTSAVRGVLGPAADFLADVVARLAGEVKNVTESIIPTISELALGIASSVSDGLDFIGENMAEVSDFAGAMAAALITPLEALAETVGGALRDGVLAIIALIFRALSGLGAMLPPLTMERPI